MVYVSPSANRFYLYRDAPVQLKVISQDFPRLGGALVNNAIEDQQESYKCPTRRPPPERPSSLPFPCQPENNDKMLPWLIERFYHSTVNQCPHLKLPGMKGPGISLHVNEDAVPYAVHTPAPVPLYWQDAVKKQLDDDVKLGVIEKVPID